MNVVVALSLLLILAEPPTQALGINVSAHSSSSSQIIFVDAMKRAQPWMAIAQHGSFASGVEVPLDRQGYPLEIPYDSPDGASPQLVHTYIFDNLGGRYPSGTYILTFKGSGILEIGGDATTRVLRKAGRYNIDVKAGIHGIKIIIRRSEKNNPIKNIRLWLPGFENAKSMFHPEFIRGLKGFSVLRFTHMMGSADVSFSCDNQLNPLNKDCKIYWKSRSRKELFTQNSPRGLAIEYLIGLSNRVGADIWPGIAHAVNDKYIRKLAGLLKQKLNRKSKIYVELSHEVWNPDGRYPQNQYFVNMGQGDRTDSQSSESTQYLSQVAYLRRCFEVFAIFKDVFGEKAKTRIVNVLPVWFANTQYSERLVALAHDRGVNPDNLSIDAIAVGAYFAVGIADAVATQGMSSSVSTEQVLRLADNSLSRFAKMVNSYSKLSKKYNIPLISYEGGQNLEVTMGNDRSLMPKLHDANRHMQMGDLYKKALDIWFSSGAGLFVSSDYTKAYSENDALGHLEWTGQRFDSAPKFQALRDRMKIFGKTVDETTPSGYGFTRVGVFPPAGILLHKDYFPKSSSSTAKQ